MMSTKTRISIFASGNGSNAENIFNYFKNNNSVEIVSILSNRKDAYIFHRAKNIGVPSFHIVNSEFRNGDKVIELLKEQNVDLIILAGFLLRIPQNIIAAFPKGIINIHPALLPKYGGKGMYGDNVHKAVKAAGDTKSGITIHLVNEHYDEGKHLAQVESQVSSIDTYEDIANKVHELEYEYFPKVIDNYILENLL